MAGRQIRTFSTGTPRWWSGEVVRAGFGERCPVLSAIGLRRHRADRARRLLQATLPDRAVHRAVDSDTSRSAHLWLRLFP